MKSIVRKVNKIINKFPECLQKVANGQKFDVKELFSDVVLDIMAGKLSKKIIAYLRVCSVLPFFKPAF